VRSVREHVPVLSLGLAILSLAFQRSLSFATPNVHHVDAVPASGAVAGHLAIPSSESEVLILLQLYVDAKLSGGIIF
jgi:hypothetical protein